MIDALSVAGTAEVALETSTSSSPGVIRPVGGDDFLCVIMPMHITREPHVATRSGPLDILCQEGLFVGLQTWYNWAMERLLRVPRRWG